MNEKVVAALKVLKEEGLKVYNFSAGWAGNTTVLASSLEQARQLAIEADEYIAEEINKDSGCPVELKIGYLGGGCGDR